MIANKCTLTKVILYVLRLAAFINDVICDQKKKKKHEAALAACEGGLNM